MTEEQIRADERNFWITKFEGWVKCHESGSSTDLIKAVGFQGCVAAMTRNDRWMPAAHTERDCEGKK